MGVSAAVTCPSTLNYEIYEGYRRRTKALQQTGHAIEGFCSFSASSRVSRQVSWVVLAAEGFGV